MTADKTITKVESNINTDFEPSVEVIEIDSENDSLTEGDPGDQNEVVNTLEDSVEVEHPCAQIIDTELDTLLKTPVGLRSAIEAVLFAAVDPIGPRRIANICGVDDTRMIRKLIEQIKIDYEKGRRGFQVIEAAGGYQITTLPMFADLILRLRNRKRRPSLSPAALETLAIIAYRGPIIRAEIEAVRGVESSGTVRNLIDMGLVEMAGRKDVIGRPPMYATTDQFLRAFGVKSRGDLPPIAELKQQLVFKQETRGENEEEKSSGKPRPNGKFGDKPGKYTDDSGHLPEENDGDPDDDMDGN